MFLLHKFRFSKSFGRCFCKIFFQLKCKIYNQIQIIWNTLFHIYCIYRTLPRLHVCLRKAPPICYTYVKLNYISDYIAIKAIYFIDRIITYSLYSYYKYMQTQKSGYNHIINRNKNFSRTIIRKNFNDNMSMLVLPNRI